MSDFSLFWVYGYQEYFTIVYGRISNFSLLGCTVFGKTRGKMASQTGRNLKTYRIQ
jgi:hypothetical protein